MLYAASRSFSSSNSSSSSLSIAVGFCCWKKTQNKAHISNAFENDLTEVHLPNYRPFSRELSLEAFLCLWVSPPQKHFLQLMEVLSHLHVKEYTKKIIFFFNYEYDV